MRLLTIMGNTKNDKWVGKHFWLGRTYSWEFWRLQNFWSEVTKNTIHLVEKWSNWKRTVIWPLPGHHKHQTQQVLAVSAIPTHWRRGNNLCGLSHVGEKRKPVFRQPVYSALGFWVGDADAHRKYCNRHIKLWETLAWKNLWLEIIKIQEPWRRWKSENHLVRM